VGTYFGFISEEWEAGAAVEGSSAHGGRIAVDFKNGSSMASLPGRFGPWKTVYERFRLWSQTGLWDQILKRLQAESEATGDIDWRLFCIDGSNVRAHRSAAATSMKLSISKE
jgi:transposase